MKDEISFHKNSIDIDEIQKTYPGENFVLHQGWASPYITIGEEWAVLEGEKTIIRFYAENGEMR